MSEITKYVLVDQYGADRETEYDVFDAAVAIATNLGGHAVIARTYVYDDSALAWTPDGSGQWPPSGD